jgi:outer membrane receptor protein involved in Fe transport
MWDYYADNVLDAYNVVDLDISYTFEDVLTLESFRLQARINNLFNRLYAAGGEGREFFPAAERNFFVATEIAF